MTRRLPAFLVIGAQRGGTTALYDALVQHPRIVPAARKEVHYFDLFFDRGSSWYRAQFPWWLHIRRSSITGEASPYYLFHPAVPARVARTLSDVRFIVLLRDPVARAFSHYQHARRQGWETLSFEDAIEQEDERLAGEAERIAEPGATSFAHQHHSYVARGRYADQLEAWWTFVDRDRFLILCSEEMFADPKEALTTASVFLGLDPVAPLDFTPQNVGGYTEEMRPSTRARLTEAFRPHNERLVRLLGRSFPWVT